MYSAGAFLIVLIIFGCLCYWLGYAEGIRVGKGWALLDKIENLSKSPRKGRSM